MEPGCASRVLQKMCLEIQRALSISIKGSILFQIEVSIGANIISTLLSSSGIILLSVNLVDIVLLECWELPACSLVKSFITVSTNLLDGVFTRDVCFQLPRPSATKSL